MRSQLKLVLIFLFWIVSPVGAAYSGTIGDGSAEIFNNNTGSARAQALKNAQRDAVEKGVGLLLDSKTKTENWRVIQDQIFTTARGYVSSYKMLKDKKSVDGKRWVVQIDAEVATANLRDKLRALRILHKKMGNKRFMVAYRSENSNSLKDDSNAVLTTKSAVEEEFIKSGFRLFNPKASRKTVSLKIDELVKLALAANAEILVEFEIVGNTRYQGRGKKFSAAKSEVRMGVYDVNTGQQISNVSVFKKDFTSSKPNSYDWNRALAKAGVKAGREAAGESMNKIVDHYKTTGDIGNAFYLAFTNYTEDEGDKVLDVLETMEGYQSLKELSNKLGYLEVEYFSNLGKSRLRRKLRQEAKTKGVRLQSKESTGNRLVFRKPGT